MSHTSDGDSAQNTSFATRRQCEKKGCFRHSLYNPCVSIGFPSSVHAVLCLIPYSSCKHSLTASFPLHHQSQRQRIWNTIRNWWSEREERGVRDWAARSYCPRFPTLSARRRRHPFVFDLDLAAMRPIFKGLAPVNTSETSLHVALIRIRRRKGGRCCRRPARMYADRVGV